MTTPHDDQAQIDPLDARIPIDLMAFPEDEDDEVAAFSRVPSLAKPFAAFGAAAGLFAILALGSFRASAREVSPLTPMIATALVGAVAGVVLRRWQSLHNPSLARDAMIVRVGMVTALAGLVSGGLVGMTTWGPDGFARFAAGGAVVGLVFLPSCLVVFDAARRAGRGRHGSLVAETDRRTVLSTTLAGIAFAGATQVPALLNAEVSSELAPVLQAGLSIVTCVGTVVAIVVLQRRDAVARSALAGFQKDALWLERVEGDDDRGHDGAARPVDLGIGADRWARSMDTDYRTSARSDVLVKGSIRDASGAFDECVRLRHRSLLVAAASLSAVSLSVALRISVLFQ